MELKEEILEELGLSKNEAKVYLALLREGLSTAGTMAEKSKVHRTNVYDAIERLVEKGLVATTMKEKTKYFEAKNPENLINVLKEKELKLKEILPQLVLDKEMAEKKAEVCAYKGLFAVRMMLDNLLECKQEILSYGIPKEAVQLLGPFIIPYHQRRIEKKIVMKHIYNEDAQDRIEYLNKLPYTEARFLPKEFNSPVSTNVCGSHVSFILWSKNPLVIEITNEEIAKQYKKYFDIIWKLAKV